MFNRSKVLLPTIILALSTGQLLRADSHARIVRISYAEGTVQLNGQNVTPNMPVTEGNGLTTGADSYAEVEFEDGSTLRLAPNTNITVAQLARLSTGEALTMLALDDGEIEVTVSPAAAGQFAMDVRNKNIRIAKAGRFRLLSTNADPLELAVWAGEATVHDRESGQEVAVKNEETFTLAADDPRQYDLEKGIEADGLDEFSQLRDQDREREYAEANGRSSGAPSVVSGGGFVDPCASSYWYPGLAQECPGFFNSYQPYPYVYAPTYYYHRHHHGDHDHDHDGDRDHGRHPHIHPPTPPVNAGVHGADPGVKGEPAKVGTVERGERPQRVFNDETFKRSTPPQEEPAERAVRGFNNQNVTSGAVPRTEPETRPSANQHPVNGGSVIAEPRQSRAESVHTPESHSSSVDAHAHPSHSNAASTYMPAGTSYGGSASHAAGGSSSSPSSHASGAASFSGSSHASSGSSPSSASSSSSSPASSSSGSGGRAK
jgi:hypothetical protein